jgi:hypothetical protein
MCLLLDFLKLIRLGLRRCYFDITAWSWQLHKSHHSQLEISIAIRDNLDTFERSEAEISMNSSSRSQVHTFKKSVSD